MLPKGIVEPGMTAPVSADVRVSREPETVAKAPPEGVNWRMSGFTRCFVLCATRPFFMSHMAMWESAPAVMATRPEW